MEQSPIEVITLLLATKKEIGDHQGIATPSLKTRCIINFSNNKRITSCTVKATVASLTWDLLIEKAAAVEVVTLRTRTRRMRLMNIITGITLRSI